MHTLRHLLTPGTTSYALIKIGLLSGVAGLQLWLRRR